MRRFLRIALVALAALLVAGGGAAYYYVIDGSARGARGYAVDIDTWRAIAAGAPDLRPTAIAVEILAIDTIPFFASQAGTNRTPYAMARTAFKLESAWGDTLIDVGMDRAIAARAGSQDTFDDAAFARIEAAMSQARRIAVTHEHPDHAALLARTRADIDAARVVRLTQPQLDGIQTYRRPEDGPLELPGEAIVALDAPMAIAPGVVMIPAPGHTPGSVMFFVAMADGREVLFVGDVAWNIDNIRLARSRPRLVQEFFMVTREDRAAVMAQIAALHDLWQAEPDLVMLTSHDLRQIETLKGEGLIRQSF